MTHWILHYPSDCLAKHTYHPRASGKPSASLSAGGNPRSSSNSNEPTWDLHFCKKFLYQIYSKPLKIVAVSTISTTNRATREGEFKRKRYVKPSQLLKYSWVIPQLLYRSSENHMSTIHHCCISDLMSIRIIRFVCEQQVTMAGGAHNHAVWARRATPRCYHAASCICIGTRHRRVEALSDFLL